MFQSQSQNIKEHSVRIVSTAFLLFFLSREGQAVLGRQFT